MISTLLELKNLSYKFPRTIKWFLEDINLELRKGSISILAGPSGSGKSTLLKIIRGMHGEYGGELKGNMFFKGQEITYLPAAKLGSKIAIVFQNPSHQLHQPRVIDEIMSAPIYQGLPWKECLYRAEEAIKGIIELDYLERDPNELSLGEQQKVALAASMAMKAELILLDEPFSYLDSYTAYEFLELLIRLKERGMGILLATHDLEIVASSADSITIISEGKLFSHGSPKTILYNQDVKHLLGRPTFIEIGDILFREKIINNHVMNWKDLCKYLDCKKSITPEKINLKNSDSFQKSILDLKNVSYRYPNGKVVIKNISLSIKQAEIFGIIGCNGSGKSTLARLMLNLLKATKGFIEISGEKIRKLSKNPIKLGYITQNPADMLFETTVLKECSYGPASLGYPEPEKKAASMLVRLGLFQFAERDPHSLSGGEQRLLSFSDVLVNQPDIIILDEPEFGLDPNSYKRIRNEIRKLNSEGKTIILITHSLESAAFLCNRIALMKDGSILKVGPTQDILSDRTLVEKSGLRYTPFLSVWSWIIQGKKYCVNEKEFIDAILKHYNVGWIE